MKLALALLLLLTGCSTVVPVAHKFPEAPQILQEPCQTLKKLEGTKISIVDYAKTVGENYTLYHECSAKNTAWQDWYLQQKQIFESTK